MCSVTCVFWMQPDLVSEHTSNTKLPLRNEEHREDKQARRGCHLHPLPADLSRCGQQEQSLGSTGSVPPAIRQSARAILGRQVPIPPPNRVLQLERAVRQISCAHSAHVAGHPKPFIAQSTMLAHESWRTGAHSLPSCRQDEDGIKFECVCAAVAFSPRSRGGHAPLRHGCRPG